MSEETTKNVLIAIDASEYSANALKCEYTSACLYLIHRFSYTGLETFSFIY